MKKFTPFSYLNKEPGRKGDGNPMGTNHVFHGKNGFPIRLFRGTIQFMLKFLKVNPIKWDTIENSHPSKNKIVQYKKKHKGWTHLHVMFFGELSDGFVKEGKSKGRENT